jgi:PAS domain S-box-containing protein
VAKETKRLRDLRGKSQDMAKRNGAEPSPGRGGLVYQQTMDDMMEGVQIIGPDWRYLYLNDVAMKHSQRTREELLGRTMMEVYPDIEKTEMFSHLRRCMKKRISHTMDNEFAYPDGTKSWFELSIQPVRWGVLILSQEITKRKKAEEMLRTNEEKFEIFANYAYDWVYWVDKNRKFVYISPSCEKISGYRQEEFIKDAGLLARIVHPEDRALFEKHRKKYHFGKQFNSEAGEFDFRLITKSGKEKWVSHTCRPIFSEDGRFLGRRASVRDITERKEAGEALRASEENYRQLFVSSPAGVFRYSKDFHVTDCNDGLVKMLKATKDKIMGLDLNSLKDRSIIPILRDALKGKEGVYEGFYHATSGPVNLWISLFTGPIFDEKYKIKGAMGIMSDISERRKGEEALKESEEKYSSFYKSSADAIMTLEPPDWRFTSGNPATVKMFRAKNERHFISKNPWQLSPKKQSDGKLSIVKAKQMIMQTMKTGSNFFEWTHKRINGEEFLATVLLTRVKTKNQTFLQATVRDTTESRKAEEALKASEENFHSIFENLYDVYYRTDMKGRITTISPSAAKYGYDPKELIGRDVLEIYSDPSERYDLLRLLKKKGAVTDYDLRLKRKSGEIAYISATSRWVLDGKGRPTGIEGMLHDVTERKKSEEIVKNYATKLEAKVKERTKQYLNEKDRAEALSGIKDEFIKNITHELKTPLSVIMGNLALLKDIAPAGREKEWSNMIDMMDRNSTRLSGSIDQILELSRIGATELRKERIYLKDMLDEVHREHLPITEMKKLEFNVQSEPAVVFGDAHLLRLAVNNLVSNAIKFTDHGSVTLRMKAIDGSISISVTDTGIGMSPETQKRIFEKFFKADSSAPGTGIGLNIVKQIVEKHGGRVSIKSKLGKGSVFEIVLPRGAEAKAVGEAKVEIKKKKRKHREDFEDERLLLAGIAPKEWAR